MPNVFYLDPFKRKQPHLSVGGMIHRERKASLETTCSDIKGGKIWSMPILAPNTFPFMGFSFCSFAERKN